MKLGKLSMWFILRHKLGLIVNVLLFLVGSIALVILGMVNNFMLLTVIGSLGFMWTGFWIIDNRHRLWRNNYD